MSDERPTFSTQRVVVRGCAVAENQHPAQDEVSILTRPSIASFSTVRVVASDPLLQIQAPLDLIRAPVPGTRALKLGRYRRFGSSRTLLIF